MNLIRSIKINKLGIAIPEKEKEIINFVNSILDDLIPYKHINYPKSMFYMNTVGKWILEQDDRNDVLRVRYDIFWSVLENKFLMTYTDIRVLLKYMVEDSFKKRMSKPSVIKFAKRESVEEEFNVSRATVIGVQNRESVEEDFLEKVSTPLPTQLSSDELIEDAFKIKVSTPNAYFIKGSFVEQTYKLDKVISAKQKVKKNKSNKQYVNEFSKEA